MRKFLAVIAIFAALLAYPMSVIADPTVNSFGVMGSIDSNYPTALITTGNSGQSLQSLLATAWGKTPDWSKAKAIWITVETNDMRIAFGTTASNSGSGLGHVIGAGQSGRFPMGMGTATVVSKTSGSAATLQVTVEF